MDFVSMIEASQAGLENGFYKIRNELKNNRFNFKYLEINWAIFLYQSSIY